MILAILLAGLIAVAFSSDQRGRIIALAASGAVALIAFAIVYQSITSASLPQAETYFDYIPAFNVNLRFGISAVSLALVVMASIVSFVTLLSGNPEKKDDKAANALVLLFEFAAIGLFTSLNLFIFFVFWDIGMIALFFMLYLLGSANRRRAAMKFLIYEIAASFFLLLGIMLIYFYTPINSFDIQYIAANAFLISPVMQMVIFACFFIAFAINMPIFPVHLWLPDAHTEASTQGSMLLSGILTKFGGYGMILAFTLFPVTGIFSNTVALLAGFSAIYLSFVLMTQRDIKRIIAYTTIVEMSIILVAIATLSSVGIAGAAFAMLAHGLTISMLFLAAGSIGFMFAERDIQMLRGVVENSASTAYTFMIGVFATTGVPLTAAFIGDVLIFFAAIKAFTIIGAIPILGLLMIGFYLYYVVNKSILSTKAVSSPLDYITTDQRVGYALLLFFIFLFGIFPFILLNFFNL